MKTEDFIVAKRFRLAELTRFPEMSVADYERRSKSLQNKLQLVQQAYLGTAERAVAVLEGWDTAGKGGLVRRLACALARGASECTRLLRPLHESRPNIICSVSGKGF